MSEILLTDRTTIETDWECGMKRWWYKEYGGKGIVPAEEADYFLVGRWIHEDFEKIASGGGVEYVRKLEEDGRASLGAFDQIQAELLYRRLGWAYAFALYIFPSMMEEWEVVSLEREVVFDRTPLWVGNIPDLILRHRERKDILRYVEYKTAKWIKKEWVQYWPYAIQLHMGIIAAGEDLGEKVKYGQVLGLQKGFEKSGKLYHPYVWAYSNGEEWQSGYSAKKGWASRPTWEYEGGMESWVRFLGEEEAQAQFVWSAPVFPDERKVKELVEQVINREREVAEGRERAVEDIGFRSRLFPSRFTKCRPAFGAPCPYLAACHNASVNEDPLGSGLYTLRTPHHELELISQLEEES